MSWLVLNAKKKWLIKTACTSHAALAAAARSLAADVLLPLLARAAAVRFIYTLSQ